MSKMISKADAELLRLLIAQEHAVRAFLERADNATYGAVFGEYMLDYSEELQIDVITPAGRKALEEYDAS